MLIVKDVHARIVSIIADHYLRSAMILQRVHLCSEYFYKVSRITSYCTLSACLPPIKGFIVELLDALIVAMDADDALMVVRISMRLSIGSVSPPQTMVVNITIASVVEM